MICILAYLASIISDDEKKFFCENANWTWHGEFGRLIMSPAMQSHLDYRLILVEDVFPHTFDRPFSMMKSDNAKAQFKCQRCEHAWTSMRARCSFYLSEFDQSAIVFLKLYTQRCQVCYSTVYPRWYYGNRRGIHFSECSMCFFFVDEICRVMKNFARTIFEDFLPSPYKSIRRSFQRKGSMHHPHQSFLCEACQSGYCY